jgi:hypothetical protein
MSLQDFQRALSDLVMSPAFRTRVAAELAAYELSERERRRITAVARDPGLRTGMLLHRAFRLSMLSNTIPRTCTALGASGLKTLVHAYWSEYPSQSMLYVKETRRFADYAFARLAAGTFEHPFLREVLEAELAILVLGKGAGAWEPPGLVSEPPKTPRLHPLCRVVAFRRDPDALFQALDTGRSPADLPEGEHFLLFTATGGGRVTMQPVPAEQGRVLLACDGGRSVAEVCAAAGVGAEVVEEVAAGGWVV